MKSKTLITGILIVLLSFCFVSLAAAQWLNVPFFSQRNGPWSNDEVGKLACSGRNRIADIGCAVTSAAMVFKYYGVNTDPGRLNAWLATHGGYDRNLNLNWRQAARCSARVAFERFEFTTRLANLNKYLARGQPPIIRIPMGGSTYHFVVVVARWNSNYYIQDPWDWSPRCKSLRVYGNRMNKIIVYRGTCSRAPQKNTTQKKLAATWAAIKK